MIDPSPSSLDLSGVGVRPAGDRRAPLPGELDLSGIGGPASPGVTPQVGPDGIAPAAPWAEDDAAAARRADAFGMPAMDRDADTYMTPDPAPSAPAITQDAVDMAGSASLDMGWSRAARGMAAGAVLAEGPDAESVTPEDDDALLRRAAWLVDGYGDVRPEDAARAREVSRATGFPLQDALANLDSGERILARAGLERTLRDLKDTAPRTLGLLADAEAVLHAKDDVPALSGMERGLSAALAVRAGWDSMWTTLTKGIVRAPIVIERGMEQMVGQTGGAVASLAGMLPRNDNSDALLRFGEAMERMGLAASKRTGERLDSPALSAPAASRYTAEQIWNDPALMLDPNWLAQNTTDAAAQLVPTMLAYLSGGGAAATVVGGWQEAAAFYESLRDSGMDRDRAQAASMVFGAVVGKLEAFGVQRMFAESTAETMVGRALHRLSVGASEAGSEYMENPIQGAIEGVARGESMSEILARVEAGLKDISVLPPSFLLGLFAPGTGALNRETETRRLAREQVAGQSGGGDDGGQIVEAPAALDATTRAALAQTGEAMSAVARDTAEAEARVQAGQQLAAAAQAADESRLRQRSPEAFAEIAARLVPDGAEQMWLDPATVETFMQSPRPQGDGGQAGEEALPAPAFGPAVLDVLGITPDALEQARATGAPLPVDTVRVLAAGQDVRAAVLDAARLTPDGMTDAEARAFNPQARLEEGVEKVRTAQRRAADVLKEERRLRKELVAAGYPKHVAQDAVTLAVSSANAFAAQYGWDASALLSRVSIQRGTAEQAQAAGQTFAQAAMYRSKAATLGDFVSEARLAPSGAKKSYTGVGMVQRQDGALAGHEVQLASDQVKHIAASHPDFSEWGRIGDVVNNGRAEALGKNRVTGGDTVAFVLEDGDGSMVVIGAPTSGRKGNRLLVLTAFRDGTQAVRNWIQEQQNAESYRNAGEVQLDPRPDGANPSGSDIGVSKKITPDGGGVNGGETFDQTAKGAPRAHVQFMEDGRSIIRVFEGADLSSVIHELGHIWFANLEQVQADGMGPALERFADRAQQIAETAEVIAAGGLPQQAVDLAARVGDAARGENPRKDLMALREELRAMTGRERQAATGTDDGGAAPASTPVLRALRGLDYALSALIAHARGLDQAAADVVSLREWAGVPMDGPLTPEQRNHLHEQTARGTEAYLREGKAPTPELAGVFQRIGQFLRKIYTSITKLDVKLTDEVRDVFGRMLTTDRQLAESREYQAALANEDAFLRDLSVAVGGLDMGVAERLTELRSRAEAAVSASMDAATLRDRAKRMREHKAEAGRIVNDRPLWQLVDYLSSQAGPGLNRAYLADLYGEDAVRSLAKRRPGLIRNEGGSMLDDVAQEFGWPDGDTAWREMYDTMALRRETKTSQIREMAEQMMAVEDAEHTPDEMLGAGEEYGDYLEQLDAELTRLMVRERWERRAARPDAAAVMRQAEALRTPRARIIAIAANEIASTPLRDIRPDRYGAAMRVALRERDTAIKRGDVAEAFRANERARIAAELLDMAHTTRRDAEEVQAKARRMLAAKPGVRDALYTEGIRRVAVNLGLADRRQAASVADAMVTLRAIVNSGVAADGLMDVAPSFPDWLLDEKGPDQRRMPDDRGRLNWKHLTPGELRDVSNLLDHLDHAGRELRGADKRSEKARVDAAAKAGAAPMAGLKRQTVHERHSWRERAAARARQALSEFSALEWQMRWADGFTSLGSKGVEGPNETVFQGVKDGENAVRVQKDQIMRRLMPAFIHFHRRMREWKDKYGRNMEVGGGGLAVPKVWSDNGITHWTQENALAFFLNMGNTSNIARLRAAYPDLPYATVARLFGNEAADIFFMTDPKDGTRLKELSELAETPTGGLALVPMRQERVVVTDPVFTLRDWEMGQEIGDVLETLWPQTEETHKELYGFPPPKLPVTGMVLHEGGRVVSLRGWYYPIRYDRRLSETVAAWNEQEDLLHRMESMFRTPTANRSFTKARSERAAGHPVKLELDVLTSHITDTLRFIHLARPVRFMDRVTQHPEWKGTFTAVFGREEMQALRDNLRYILRDPLPVTGAAAAFMEPLRPYIVQYALGGNFRTALLQLTALFPGMYDVGAKTVARGVRQFIRNPRATMRAIHDLSPYMASRWNNIDQDMQRAARSLVKPPKVLARMFGREVTWDHVLEANMLLIKVADAIASHSVWQGAFERRLGEVRGEMAEEDAVREAVRYADNAVKKGNPDADASSKARFLRTDSSMRAMSVFASATTQIWQRQHTHNLALRHNAITKGQYASFIGYQYLLTAVATALLRLLINGADDPEEAWDIYMDSQMDMLAGALPLLGSVLTRGDVPLVSDTPLRLLTRGKKSLERAADGPTAEAWWAAFAIASFVAQVPAEPVARRGVRGWEQWQRGDGTPLSILMPRPGK